MTAAQALGPSGLCGHAGDGGLHATGPYSEGETGPGTERRIAVFRVEATACNGGGACPDAAAVTNFSMWNGSGSPLLIASWTRPAIAGPERRGRGAKTG